MKRILLPVLAVFFLLITLWPAAALACAMKLTTVEPSPATGDLITFRLERTLTHRSCVLPIEQTTIKVSGGEVVDPGIWKKGTPDVLEFKVRFTQPGAATVKIERNCPKDGLQTTQLTVEVSAKTSLPSSNSNQALSLSTSKANAAPVQTNLESSQNSTPSSLPVSKSSEKSSRTITWQEGLTDWWPQYANHFLSWLAIFTAGLLLFLGKVRSLRKPLLVFSLILTGFYLGGCPTPVGAWYYLLTGNLNILGLVLFLLAVPVILSFFWGRVFCAWMCPIGAAQELVKSEKIRWTPPPPVHRYLRLAKYILLVLFSGITLWTGINYWSHHEPFKTLFNFDGSVPSFVLLFAVMGWSVVTERPFCRYFCPLGALLAITSRFSFWKIRPEAALCVHCSLCAKGNCCPTAAVQIVENEKNGLPVIDPAECIRCGKCEELCPRGALAAQCVSKILY